MSLAALTRSNFIKFAEQAEYPSGLTYNINSQRPSIHPGTHLEDSNPSPPAVPGTPPVTGTPPAVPGTPPVTGTPPATSTTGNIAVSDGSGGTTTNTQQENPGLGTLDPAKNKPGGFFQGDFWKNHGGLTTGLGVGAGVLGLGALTGNKMGGLGSLGTLALLGGGGYLYDKLGGWDTIKKFGGGGFGRMMDARSKSDSFAQKNPERWKTLQSMKGFEDFGEDAGMLGRAKSFINAPETRQNALSGKSGDLWGNLEKFTPDELSWAQNLPKRWEGADPRIQQMMTSFGGATPEGAWGPTRMMEATKLGPAHAMAQPEYAAGLRNILDNRAMVDTAFNTDPDGLAAQALDATSGLKKSLGGAVDKVKGIAKDPVGTAKKLFNSWRS
jgi:hypothetical protein